jgi:hypothetical protein
MAMGVSISSILLSARLKMTSYQGSVLNANPELLAKTISDVMIVAAALCIAGTCAAVLRNVDVIENYKITYRVSSRQNSLIYWPYRI